ncbi:MAG TPA: hypothetical protein VGE52_20515 [Pirellulales bacterium]
MSFRTSMLLFVLAAFVSTGCGKGGPEMYTIAGQASYKDQPIADGEIILRPKDARGKAYAAKIEGGRFTVETTGGPKTVEIVGYRETGKFSTANPGEKTPVREMYIPKKYNEKTELVADIKAGQSTLDFPLK